MGAVGEENEDVLGPCRAAGGRAKLGPPGQRWRWWLAPSRYHPNLNKPNVINAANEEGREAATGHGGQSARMAHRLATFFAAAEPWKLGIQAGDRAGGSFHRRALNDGLGWRNHSGPEPAVARGGATAARAMTANLGGSLTEQVFRVESVHARPFIPHKAWPGKSQVHAWVQKVHDGRR
jgi:hypothetical protein